MAYFTGDEDDHWAVAVYNDVVYFSNGVEVLSSWNGTDSFITKPVTGWTAYAAKQLLNFGNRLVAFHTVESGTPKPKRVRWSKNGTATDTTSPGAGFADIEDAIFDDVIVSAEYIERDVIIYGKKNTVLMQHQNDPNEPFTFTKRIPEKGILGQRCTTSLGNSIATLFFDGIFGYSGGTEREDVASNINNELLRILSPQYINRSFVVHDEFNKEVLFYIPLVGSERPGTYFRLLLDNGSWSRGARSYTGWGTYELQSGETWDEDGDTWDSDPTRWDDSSNTQLTPLIIYGDASGRTYLDDPTIKNLDGAAIDGWFETKDFGVLDAQGNWLENVSWEGIRFYARGDSVKVYYSTDFGTTYTELGDSPATLTSLWAMYEMNFQATGRHIRFKYRNSTTSSGFEVKAIRPGYQKLSDSP